MHIDISKFDANRQYILDFYNHKSGKNISYTISMGACITGVPCIAIAYWLGHETNWCEQSIAAIKRLTDFYGYSHIDGKPEGAPI